MARNNRNKATGSTPSDWGKRGREGIFILAIALAAYLLLSLGSYHPTDPSWSQQFGDTVIANNGGRAGAWLADIFLFALGYLAFLLPFVVVYICWRACWQERMPFSSSLKKLDGALDAYFRLGIIFL